MPTRDVYITTDDMQQEWGVAKQAGAAAAGLLTSAIRSASRQIDRYCSRHFYTVTERRLFMPTDALVLTIPDLLTLTSIYVDEHPDRPQADADYDRQWSTEHYVLEPQDSGWRVEPYTRIRACAPERFPRGVAEGVAINGTWGYQPTVPEDIRIACGMIAARIYQELRTPSGYTVGGEGPERAADPLLLSAAVRELIDPYRRMESTLTMI